MASAIVENIEELNETPDIVYDIGVADNHCFFANGILVHNSPNVVLDEAALIDDTTYSTVKRMLGDAIGGDSCLVEIGNPFFRNHFYRVGKDENYHKIFIDYKQAIVEGRFTEDFIEEMRKEQLFNILYACEFPPDDSMDEEGWTQILTALQLEKAQREEPPFGEPRLGVDVAAGGNCFNVWTLRYQNIAFILRKDKNPDTMGVVGQTITLAEEHGVKWPNVFIDKTGVGVGVCDRLWEQGHNITPFVAGEKADRDDRYVNRRAEATWRAREWLLGGGALSPDEDWEEGLDVRWKVQSDRRIQIMPKEQMMRRGIQSPDIWDSLCLTFGTQDIDRPTMKMTMEARELREEIRKRKQKNKSGVLSKI